MRRLTLIFTMPVLLLGMLYCIMHDWLTGNTFFESLTMKFDGILDNYSKWIKRKK